MRGEEGEERKERRGRRGEGGGEREAGRGRQITEEITAHLTKLLTRSPTHRCRRAPAVCCRQL